MTTLEPESYACLAACYAQLGRDEESKTAAEEFYGQSDKGAMDIVEWRSYWATPFQIQRPSVGRPSDRRAGQGGSGQTLSSHPHVARIAANCAGTTV